MHILTLSFSPDGVSQLEPFKCDFLCDVWMDCFFLYMYIFQETMKLMKIRVEMDGGRLLKRLSNPYPSNIKKNSVFRIP